MSDHNGAALLLPSLPAADELIGDRGYDSNQFRAALARRDILACIPSTRSRKTPLPYDKLLYRQRHRIENAFGRLKDWRRIATRYDRCANTFFSAICIAASVTFWLRYRVLSLARAADRGLPSVVAERPSAS
jgi:transposase